jgi:hypothetical protein
MKIDKMRITYDVWVNRYKGKSIQEITQKEHKLFNRQYKAWRMGNVEKM